jgi:DNA invertase Pin-like site-specific DNA recombinase
MKIALYDRVSTQNQSGNYSDKSQAEDGISFALSHNMEYEIFRDVESGGSVTRDGMTRMIAAIEARTINAVWFSSWDRLARDGEFTEYFKKVLKKYNVKVFEKGIETNLYDDGVDFVTSIHGKMAEIEKRKINRRTVDGMHKSYDAGQRRYARIYGYAPSGMVDDKKRIVWAVVREEAFIIQKVFSLVGAGAGLSDVSRQLTRDGYKARDGGTITHYTIRQILKHPEYCGLSRNKKNELIESIAYPAIIDKDTFNSCVKAYPKQITAKKKGRQTAHLCSGVLTCKSCGAKYFYWEGVKRKKTDTRDYAYAHGGRGIECSNRKVLHYGVMNGLMSVIYKKAMTEKPYEILKKLTDDIYETEKDVNTQIEGVAKEIDKLKKENAKIAIKMLDEAYKDDETLDARYKANKKRIVELVSYIEEKRKVVELMTAKYQQVLVTFSVGKLDEWKAGNEKAKHILLQQVVEKIEVDGDVITVELIDGREFVYNYEEEKNNFKELAKQAKELDSIYSHDVDILPVLATLDSTIHSDLINKIEAELG